MNGVVTLPEASRRCQAYNQLCTRLSPSASSLCRTLLCYITPDYALTGPSIASCPMQGARRTTSYLDPSTTALPSFKSCSHEAALHQSDKAPKFMIPLEILRNPSLLNSLATTHDISYTSPTPNAPDFFLPSPSSHHHNPASQSRPSIHSPSPGNPPRDLPSRRADFPSASCRCDVPVGWRVASRGFRLDL